jgi:hypothetical protein
VTSLPYPTVDQLADAVTRLAATNPKASSLDLSGFIDASLVKSAADRGLDH